MTPYFLILVKKIDIMGAKLRLFGIKIVIFGKVGITVGPFFQILAGIWVGTTLTLEMTHPYSFLGRDPPEGSW